MPGSELEAAVKEPITKELITILYAMETESLQIHVHILYVCLYQSMVPGALLSAPSVVISSLF